MALMGRLFGGKAEPDWVEPAELAARLSDDAAPVVIDVRRPDEFDGPLGHISGARNIPLDTLAEAVAALRQEERPVVMVCHTDRRSSAAARIVAEAGGRLVSVLRGGMVAWRGGGF